MAAGILSYQLCDREFVCEQCPLDAAMRMHFDRDKDRKKSLARLQVPPRRSSRLSLHYQYSRKHCWVKMLPGRVRVGIEPTLAALLPQPTSVILPALDKPIEQDQPAALLVYGKETLPIYAPMDGVVVAVHEQVASRWLLLKQDPYTPGWLYELAMPSQKLGADPIRDRSEAAHDYDKDETKLQALITEAIQTGSGLLGNMAQDGGERISDLSLMLGPSRYISLLRKVYAGDHTDTLNLNTARR
jgi:glycine cleavage system H protein